MADNEVDWDALTFSLTKTDFMYTSECELGGVWRPGKIQPYGNLSIDPAAGVLNYGQGIFEGMKAQRTSKGRVVLFRPERNARRFQRGADRLGMPPVPETIFLDAVEQVVVANQRWIPLPGEVRYTFVLYYGELVPSWEWLLPHHTPFVFTSRL